MENHLGLFSSKAKRRKKADAAEVRGAAAAVRIIRSVGKKDRHSKVCTARGTRDRRVRLSPKTAIQFYDVQDRLGYDRPSKAIDWLMKEARAAIDALAEQPPPPPAAYNGETQQMQLNDANPIPSFGFFSNHSYGAVHLPDSDQLQVYSDADFNNSSLFRSELYGSEYQNGFSPSPAPLSYGNSHFPAFGGHGQIFSQIREPLQSSCPRISSSYHNPMSINRFPGFDFSNDELPDFTAPLEEDEMDKIPVSGKPCSTNSFLHYED